MDNIEYFSELKIQNLKVCAHKWAQQHTVINRVLLCISAEKGPRYVLLVVGPKLPNTKNKIGKKTPDKPDKEPIFPDAEKDPLFFDKLKFFNWASEDCAHIREDLSMVYKDDVPIDFIHNWMWFNVEEDEDPPDFILEEFSCKLYERKKSNGIINVEKK